MEAEGKKIEVRTDLAVEERESFSGDGGEVSGVSLREWRDAAVDVKWTEVRVLNEKGARAMGKPIGTYLTMEADRLTKKDEDYHAELSEKLAEQMRILLKNLCGNEKWENRKVLVVGLGNLYVTPDALGPKVVGNLQVTRHLDEEYGEGFCRKHKLPIVSGIVPGVMAQTGMETAEILKGIIRETRPEVLIAIDALAARSIRRLGTTIQLTDTGIHPGSGVGNHRHSLTRESLGIPVLAIGVPTVVGAAAIVHDTVDTMIKALVKNPDTEKMGTYIRNQNEQEQYALISEWLEPEFGNLYVTPPNIDQTIALLSNTISEGIHGALFSFA